MKEGAKGRRRGQHFPSTAIHDLILFRSTETFPGMRICCKKWETQGEKKMNSEKEMMESGVMWRWRRSGEKKESEQYLWGACWTFPASCSKRFWFTTTLGSFDHNSYWYQYHCTHQVRGWGWQYSTFLLVSTNPSKIPQISSAFYLSDSPSQSVALSHRPILSDWRRKTLVQFPNI